MSLDGGPKAGCLDEEAALDFVQGRLAEAQVRQVDEHVDGCQRCRMVLAEAARGLRSRATGMPLTASTVPTAPIAVTRLAPGEKLSARYRILRFIARGGMGEVYEAHDLMLNTRLALKTLAATISDDPHAIRRLKQEVNLARLITHPNVCRIFDLGVHEESGAPSVPGVLFITMELISGVSLGERIRKDGRMDGATALPIARAIVAAIGAAHRANIIHRDLKSDNVMLAPDEHGAQRVVVMDFGLARAASPAPDMNSADAPTLAGTLAYMAPEQLEGKPISAVTDIYALGVVMYEMLAGHLPFKGEPAPAAAWKRVIHPAPPLDDAAGNVDQRWREIVAACLERDPARRPRSADQVARQLQALESLPDTLPAISVSARSRSSSSLVGRRTGLAVAALAALFAIVGVRTVTRWLRNQASEAIGPPVAVPAGMVIAGGTAAKPAATPSRPDPAPAPEAKAAVPLSPSPPAAAAVLATGPGPGGAAVPRRKNPRGRAHSEAAPPSPPYAGAVPIEPSATPPAPAGKRRSEDPDDGFVVP